MDKIPQTISLRIGLLQSSAVWSRIIAIVTGAVAWISNVGLMDKAITNRTTQPLGVSPEYAGQHPISIPRYQALT